MIKLKKIINKHNNAPEPEVLQLACDISAAPDTVYFFYDSSLRNYRPEGNETSYYLSTQSIEEMESDRSCKCFRITPDMIFEATCSDSLTPMQGGKFLLDAENERSGFDRVKVSDSSTTESDGFFVNVDNWYKTKKVLVKFHCKQ